MPAGAIARLVADERPAGPEPVAQRYLALRKADVLIRSLSLSALVRCGALTVVFWIRPWGPRCRARKRVIQPPGCSSRHAPGQKLYAALRLWPPPTYEWGAAPGCGRGAGSGPAGSLRYGLGGLGGLEGDAGRVGVVLEAELGPCGGHDVLDGEAEFGL
jgi:hypothetical protein